MEEINKEEKIIQNQNEQIVQENNYLHEDQKSKSNDRIYEEWKRYIELRKKAKEDNQ